MAMRDETRMLLESMDRLFLDKCTKQVVDAAEKGSFPDALWQAISETGVPLAALPEGAGGADAEWSDLFLLLRVAGRYAAPVPLAAHMLAGWIAAAAELEPTDQPMTVAQRIIDHRQIARLENVERKLPARQQQCARQREHRDDLRQVRRPAINRVRWHRQSSGVRPGKSCQANRIDDNRLRPSTVASSVGPQASKN